MTSRENAICERLKGLGYAAGNRIRLYGQEFELVSNPITLHEELFFVDGVESKSGERLRVRIPLPIIRMIRQDLRAA